MHKETACVVGEFVGEVVLGAALGTAVNKTIMSKCDNPVEKGVIYLGTLVGGWMVGRVWAKQWYKFCDAAFDTDFEEVIENL